MTSQYHLFVFNSHTVWYSVGFCGQFQMSVTPSIVFLGPRQTTDWYIFEIGWFVNWCPQGCLWTLLFQGGSGFCNHLDKFVHDANSLSLFPWWGQRWTDFPDLISFRGPRRTTLQRVSHTFLGRMFSFGIHFAETLFEEAPGMRLVTTGIVGIPEGSFTPFRRCLITPGPIFYFWNTCILWTWHLEVGRKATVMLTIRVLHPVGGSRHARREGMEICYGNAWLF